MERFPLIDASSSDGSTFWSLGTKRKKELENDDSRCCNCKRSKCLKLYCECFSAGIYCAELCKCDNCLNRLDYEDTVSLTRQEIQSRNKYAFTSKIAKLDIEIQGESGVIQQLHRHKRGCNCKKSFCLKKYCECYQASVACSSDCRCEDCKNTFGRKNECGEIDILEYKTNDESLERDPNGGNIEGTTFTSELGVPFQYNSQVSPLTPVYQGSNDNFLQHSQFQYNIPPASSGSLKPSFVESPSFPGVSQGNDPTFTGSIYRDYSLITPVQRFGESKFKLEPDSKE